MKKIGIITINDNNNYGNRLQNYATQEMLKKIEVMPSTIKNSSITNKKESIVLVYKLRELKRYYIEYKQNLKNDKRIVYFQKFNKNINMTNKNFSMLNKIIKNEYDYFITRK